MRQRCIILPKLGAQSKECLLRLAPPGHDSKRPIGDLLIAGEPFVRPGKKNRPGKTALYHAIDVPAEHFSLLFLRMPDRVHAEFPEDKRALFSQILQP